MSHIYWCACCRNTFEAEIDQEIIFCETCQEPCAYKSEMTFEEYLTYLEEKDRHEKLYLKAQEEYEGKLFSDFLGAIK